MLDPRLAIPAWGRYPICCTFCVIAFVVGERALPADQVPTRYENAYQAAPASEDEDEQEETNLPSGYEEAPQAAADEEADQNAAAEQVDVPSGYEQAEQAGDDEDKENGEQVDVAVAVQAAAAVRFVPANGQNQPDAANIKKMADSLTPGLQRLFNIELDYVNRVLELRDDEIMAIEARLPQQVTIIAAEFAQVQWQMNVGGWRGEMKMPDAPAKVVRQSVRRVIQEVLSERGERYVEEVESANSFAERAGAVELVLHLSERLTLSPEQYEPLVESLASAWDSDWEQTIKIMADNPQFFPQVPDELITRHLSPTQKKVWRGMQKHHSGGWFAGMHELQNNRNNQFIAARDWFHDEPTE